MAAALIPNLGDFSSDWLATSEASIVLSDGPRLAGLSFFFHAESECAEFTTRAGLGKKAMGCERAIRRRIPLLPRYWLKIHYDCLRPCGLSHYFQIDPSLNPPLTTLKYFLRTCGMRHIEGIEPLLKPVLESADTVWGLAVKRFRKVSFPRIFCQIARPLLKDALDVFVGSGYISNASSFCYREWDNRLSGSDTVFLSIDPTLQRLASIDFCDIPVGEIQEAQNLNFPAHFSYLKIRVASTTAAPDVVGYLPLQEVIS